MALGRPPLGYRKVGGSLFQLLDAGRARAIRELVEKGATAAQYPVELVVRPPRKVEPFVPALPPTVTLEHAHPSVSRVQPPASLDALEVHLGPSNQVRWVAFHIDEGRVSEGHETRICHDVRPHLSADVHPQSSVGRPALSPT